MTRLALRDHARQILEAVAADIETPQTSLEQSEKSKGRAPRVMGAPETAAQTHAVLRAASGFDIAQIVAEYRALRASVLRLWTEALHGKPLDPDELMRFNEAIDQAIAESVGHFHVQVERARNLLLGMLGHDMQSPLSAILLTAKHLAALKAGEDVSVAADRLIRSGASMQALLDDLVDFNRTRFGLGLKIDRQPADLAEVVGNEVELLRAAYPRRRIEVETTGETRGRWDAVRLQQVLRNLVSNAVRYGSRDTPVLVELRGHGDHVSLEVKNQGAAIDPVTLDEMFEPLKRGLAAGNEPDDRPGLGLGLFIVREIANAHGGDVSATSRGGETTFVVRLPREEAAP